MKRNESEKVEVKFLYATECVYGTSVSSLNIEEEREEVENRIIE